MSLFKKLYGHERSASGKSLDGLVFRIVVIGLLAFAIHYKFHLSWWAAIIDPVLAVTVIAVLIGFIQGLAIRAEQNAIIEKIKRGEPWE